MEKLKLSGRKSTITTDPQDELFDIVNEHDEVIGRATRRECHTNKSLIHRSIHIGIFNSNGQILLQQRSLTKDTDPGLWCLSASGHVLSGHTYVDTAVRELQEELGIFASIQLLKIHLIHASHETEFTAVFKGFHNGPFTPHPQEISRVNFFAPKELHNLHLTEQATINLKTVFKIP